MQKLEEIQFTRSDIYTHLSSNGSFATLLDNLTVTGNAVNTAYFGYHLYRNINDAYHNETQRKQLTKGNVWKRFRNHLVCDYSGDTTTLIIAFEYLHGEPEAQKALWHYFTGNGAVVEVDTGKVLREDTDFKKNVFAGILAQKNKGKNSGRVNIQQNQYSNSNWRDTFGAVWVDWAFRSPYIIDIWISNSADNEYQWHPDDPRHSQCIHQAMDRAQKYGAQKFRFSGTKYSTPVKDLESMP